MTALQRSFLPLIALASVGVAGYAILVYGFLPLGTAVHPDMRVVFESNRLGIYAHVFGAAVALLLGPLQFSARLRGRNPSLHRWLGRIYLGIGVLIGGLAGLYMAFLAYGGLPAKSGFAMLAVAWLYTGFRAYTAILRADIATHQRWMMRNFALTLAAVTLRIYLPSSTAAGFDFDLAYPAIAWLCWVPNLLIAESLIRRTLPDPD